MIKAYTYVTGSHAGEVEIPVTSENFEDAVIEVVDYVNDAERLTYTNLELFASEPHTLLKNDGRTMAEFSFTKEYEDLPDEFYSTVVVIEETK